MVRIFLLCIVIICLTLGLESSSRSTRTHKELGDHAVSITTSKKGLDRILSWAVPRAKYVIDLFRVPDFHDKINVAILGDINIDVTDFEVQDISVETLTFSNNNESPSAFNLDLRGLNLRLKDKWHYKQRNFPFLEGHGDSTIQVRGGGAKGKMIMKITEDGKLYPWVESSNDLEIDIGDLSLDIHGGISGQISNILMKLFGNILKPLLTSAIRDFIVMEVNGVLKAMLTSYTYSLPISFPNQTMELDLTLPRNPEFEDDYAHVMLKGSWNVEGESFIVSPIIPETLPSVPKNDRMANIFISHAAIENFFWRAIRSRLLFWRITDDMVPTESPYRLRTDSLKYVFPELYKIYNQSEVVMHVKMDEVPKISITERDGMFMSVNTTIDFFVVIPQRPVPEEKFVFSLSAVFSFTNSKLGLVNVGDGSSLNVTGLIDSADIRLSLFYSSIGNVNIGYIQNQVRIILLYGYLPQLREELQAGIPMKLPEILFGQLHMSETEYYYQDGYIDFSTSFELVPKA